MMELSLPPPSSSSHSPSPLLSSAWLKRRNDRRQHEKNAGLKRKNKHEHGGVYDVDDNAPNESSLVLLVSNNNSNNSNNSNTNNNHNILKQQRQRPRLRRRKIAAWQRRNSKLIKMLPILLLLIRRRFRFGLLLFGILFFFQRLIFVDMPTSIPQQSENTLLEPSSASSSSSLSVSLSLSSISNHDGFTTQPNKKPKSNLEYQHHNNNINNNINTTNNSNSTRTTATTATTARQYKLSPLTQFDKTKFTVRINTWRRNQQLIASVKHLSTCQDSIAHVIIVWCDEDNQPPIEIQNMVHASSVSSSSSAAAGAAANHEKRKQTKIKIEIEYHSINSLNERFNILTTPMTKGILSMDDDVLRPCNAMDDGFFRWTDHPDKMVGYDYRTHLVVDNDDEHNDHDDNHHINHNPSTTWSYGYLSETRQRNEYSMVLPRFSFLHVDYMHFYMTSMPPQILQMIDAHFNCEDIAMSFFISSLTNGTVPLLASQWSIATMVKLSTSDHAISQNANHKEIRNKCVNLFAYLLGLKADYDDNGMHSISTSDSSSSSDNGTSSGSDLSSSQLRPQKTPLPLPLRPLLPFKSHFIWDSKHNIKTPFGIGDMIESHPFSIKSDFVPRRKEFIQSMRQWVIKQQEQEGRNNEKESFFFNSFHTLKKQMISLGVYSD